MASGTAAYRSLLRAIRIAFQGDITTLNAARSAARDQFFEHRNAASDEINDAIAHATAVTKILRENVVQGRQTGEETYKLNIHEHTERGDNATVKKLDNRVKSFKDMRCS